MSIRLGIVMDPIDAINIKKDSSFAMLLEAQSRSYEIHYMEPADIRVRAGVAKAKDAPPERAGRSKRMVQFRF